MSDIRSNNDRVTAKQSRLILMRCLIWLTFYLFAQFAFFYFISINNIDCSAAEFMGFGIASGLALMGGYSISQRGLLPHNMFLLVWFLFLSLNFLKLGEVQSDKTVDQQLILFSPLLLFLCISASRTKETRNPRLLEHSNWQLLGKGCVIIFLILKSILIASNGARLFDILASGNFLDGGDYQSAGISGLSYLCMWTALIFFDSLPKKWKKILVSSVLLFAVLDFKRGDLVRYGIFFFFLYHYKSRTNFSMKRFARAGFIIFGLVFVFSWTGEVREDLRGGIDIGRMIDSRVHSNAVNWIYIYTAMPFDVLLLHEPSVAHGSLFEFSSRLFSVFWSKDPLNETSEYLSSVSIRGVNASTFLSMPISLSGSYFYLDLIIIGMFLAICFSVGYTLKARGFVAFLLMVVALFPFGNYLAEPSFFIIIVVNTILLIGYLFVYGKIIR